MAHKFKIGTVLNHDPKDRLLSTALSTYTVTGVMPATDDQHEYRIKPFSEGFRAGSVRK
jgi:hypothetical protein